jgi:hypothetical protein
VKSVEEKEEKEENEDSAGKRGGTSLDENAHIRSVPLRNLQHLLLPSFLRVVDAEVSSVTLRDFKFSV